MQRGGSGGRGARDARFGGRSLELTKALTSVVSLGPITASRASLAVEFNSSDAEVAQARREALQRILRALPPRDVVIYLVGLYFTRVSWLFHHLHSPSFLIELDAFYAMVVRPSPPLPFRFPSHTFPNDNF